MRTTDSKIIQEEYDSKNNWKDIYQWKRVVSKGNTEQISELLLKDFHSIKWSASGLRVEDFRITAHQGYCQINTHITQFTEKRFCRALFNEYNSKPHPLLGKIIDYETPLTAPNQRNSIGKKVNQGDIDLIAEKSDALLFIEAKKSKSNESLLKAILEIFVYVIRLQEGNLLNQLKKEFKINPSKKVVPCILTFKDSTSGKQIIEINKYPVFLELIHLINLRFQNAGINELEFYLVEEPYKDYDKILKTLPSSFNSKQKKILLNRKVKVVQYFPSYLSDSNLFQNQLNSNLDTDLLEMLLRSYLLYNKNEAIQFIILRINAIQDRIDSFNKVYPKNEILTKETQGFIKRNIPFTDAYLKIAGDYIFPEFLDLNLRLVNPSRYKILVPIISHFENELVFNKLIHSYENIRIVSSKDYDGVSSQKIDLIDEGIIINALCKFDSDIIVPLLKKSILTGAIGDVKLKVVNKLLGFISKQEILDFLPDLKSSDTMLIQALTNKKENTEWVINYLNKI
jgi:hypothetical protein